MKFQYSTDGGKTWKHLQARLCRYSFLFMPGSLTLRLPAWYARFWQRGRSFDGKRAGKTSLKHTVPWTASIAISAGSTRKPS